MVFSRPGPTFLQQPAAGAASSRVASSQEAATGLALFIEQFQTTR